MTLFFKVKENGNESDDGNVTNEIHIFKVILNEQNRQYDLNQVKQHMQDIVIR